MNVDYKKMVLKTVPFSKLLKLEVPELAENVISVVEKHNPEELLIKDVFDLLVAEKPQIDLLVSQYRGHVLTPEVEMLSDKLFLYVSAIRFQVHLSAKEKKPNTQKHLPIVKFAIKQHLHQLRSSRNRGQINRKVTQFLDEIKMSTALSEAITALGLIEHTDNLSVTLNQLRLKLSLRTESISQRPKETSKELANSVIFALKNVFKGIEVAKVKHPDLDYGPLFDELNETLRRCRNQVSLRMATNKRKAQEDEVEEVESDEAVAEDEGVGENASNSNSDNERLVASRMNAQPTTTRSDEELKSQVEISRNVEFDNNGIGNGVDLNIDNKKTVASSAKQMQLPALNKKG